MGNPNSSFPFQAVNPPVMWVPVATTVLVTVIKEKPNIALTKRSLLWTTSDSVQDSRCV